MSNVATEATLGYPPLPADEYDTYLSHLLAMISSGASDCELVGYLTMVEREYIGLCEPSGDKGNFVAALRNQT